MVCTNISDLFNWAEIASDTFIYYYSIICIKDSRLSLKSSLCVIRSLAKDTVHCLHPDTRIKKMLRKLETVVEFKGMNDKFFDE